MKTLSKLYAELVTRWKSDDFWRIRLKLTFLYLLIVAVILLLFSLFLFVQVQSQVQAIAGRVPVSDTVLTIVTELAVATVPGGEVTAVEQEFLAGQLVYVVEVVKDGHEIDVYLDQTADSVLAVDDEDTTVESFSDVLINDLLENLLVANLVILLLVGVTSYSFAGWTLKPVQRKMQQQEQFSNDVAHEIRTPLAAMLAATESVLRKDESLPTYQAVLQDFKRETKRLVMLTEDLLLTTRGQQPVNFTPVALREVVVHAVERLQPYALERGIVISSTQQSSVTLHGNQIMLERMIENILHNAIKFSPADSTVSVNLKNNQLVITDQGVGMSSEVQMHVFERLFTANTARDERTQGGTGLGLSIVKQIAEQHKVTIALTSDVGKGTRVTLTFLQ